MVDMGIEFYPTILSPTHFQIKNMLHYSLAAHVILSKVSYEYCSPYFQPLSKHATPVPVAEYLYPASGRPGGGLAVDRRLKENMLFKSRTPLLVIQINTRPVPVPVCPFISVRNTSPRHALRESRTARENSPPLFSRTYFVVVVYLAGDTVPSRMFAFGITNSSASALAGEKWGEMGRFLPISPQILKGCRGQLRAMRGFE